MISEHFSKICQQIQLSLNSDKNTGCFTWRLPSIHNNILLNSSYNDKCFKKKFYRQLNHTYYVPKLLPKNCAIYEVIWKNMVQPDRPQMPVTMQHMRNAWWISKATYTLRISNIYCFSLATMVMQCYTACLVFCSDV